MVDCLGVHGPDNAEVIGDFGNVFKDSTDFLPGVSVFLKREIGGFTGQFLALQLGNGLTFGEGFGHGLTIQFPEFGFVIKGLEMGGTSCHVEEDDPFDFRGCVKGINNATPAGKIGAGIE